MEVIEKKQAKSIYDRERYLQNRDIVLERTRQRDLANKEQARERAKRWQLANPERVKQNQAAWQQRAKQAVLNHYSSGDIKCAICGERRIDCLSIDHINNNGYAHRKQIGGRGGSNFYRWLINQGFPVGYQVLCMNCQWVKAAEYRRTKEAISKS